MRVVLRLGMLFAVAVTVAAACDDDDHAPFADPGDTPGRPGVGGAGGGSGGGGGGGGDGALARCELSPISILEDAAGAGLDFDVAGGEDDFLVAFTDSRDGVEDVFSRRIDADGQLGDEQRVTDDPALARGPAVVATDSGFLVAFSDDTGETGDFEVSARAIGPTGVPVGDAELVSRALSPTADDLDAAFARGTGPGESLLAFSSIDFGVTQARITPIDDDAVLAGDPQLVSDAFELGGAVDLAALGIGPTGVASFLDTSGDLQLVELTDTGTAASPTTPVRSGDDFTGTFDLAAGASGGVFVVGFDRGTDDPALGVRTIDAQGNLGTLETPLFTDATVTGRSPAAVALEDGFAVAFRRTTSAGTTIRLAFLDETGELVGERDVAAASLATGGLRLARAESGALVVVFDEPSGAGVSLRGVRVVCP